MRLNVDSALGLAPVQERRFDPNKPRNGSQRHRTMQDKISEDSDATDSDGSRKGKQLRRAHRAIMKEGVGQVLGAYFSPKERKSILKDLKKRAESGDDSSSTS